jgi:hypothetical protein
MPAQRASGQVLGPVTGSWASRLGRLGHLLLVVSVAGWLHVIWNGEPRVMLIDDQGTARRVVIAEGLTRPLGGLRALSQRRVVITGEPESGPPEIIRVLTIQLQPENR